MSEPSAKVNNQRTVMDIHENQAKELLSGCGVMVPPGGVAYSPEQAVYVATELGGWHWAVKAQIHAGGRGKAGGVKLCRTYQEVATKKSRREGLDDAGAV